MANRLINPGSRHFTTQGTAPLSGGLMYFYAPGTLNLKDTYTDETAATPNANPVELSAGGLEPNIFLDGAYRVILKDSANVQIWDRDDVNISPDVPFLAWVSTVSYPLNWVVIGSDGYFYVSQANNNLNNDPTSDAVNWFLFARSIGVPVTPNGNLLTIDTSAPQKIGSATVASVRALVPLSTAVASNSATVDFTGITNAYDEYEVHVLRAVPQNDGSNMHLRTSANNGVAFDSGASDYQYGTLQVSAVGSPAVASAVAAQIVLNDVTTGSATGENISVTISIISPAAGYAYFNWTGSVIDTGGTSRPLLGGANRASASAANAIRLYFGTGNIVSGIFTLYGVRRT